MKHVKKFAVCTCLAGLLLVSMAGCGSDGSDSNSGNGSGTDYSNTTVTAQVQTIDGGSVTAIAGILSQRQGGPSDQVTSGGAAGGPGGAENGTAPNSDEAPQPPSGESQNPPPGSDGNADNGTASPGAFGGRGNGPTDGQNGAPEGEAPGGGGPGGSIFTADGESISFEITDAATITLESRSGASEGSLSDIQAGSILEITFGDGNTVTAVTVKELPTGGPGTTAPDGTDSVSGDGSEDQDFVQ